MTPALSTPRLDPVLRTMRDVRAETLRVCSAIRGRLFWYPMNWLRMWHVAYKVGTVRRQTDEVFRILRDATQSIDGFYLLPQEATELLENVHDLRKDIVKSSRIDDMCAGAGLFLKQIETIRKSKSGILETCDRIIAIVPKVHPEARARARAERDRGELVDLETLFNDLQGVQH